MYFARRSKLRVTNCPPWSWEVLSQICISQHRSLWSTCRCWSCAATAGIKVISSCCRKWASPYLSWKWRGEFTLGVGGLWKRWKILTPFSKGNWIEYECIINTCYFRGRNAQTWKDKVICPAHAANWRQTGGIFITSFDCRTILSTSSSKFSPLMASSMKFGQYS